MTHSDHIAKTVVLPVLSWRRTGGLESVIMDIALSLQSLGWKVQVYSMFDQFPVDTISGIECIELCPSSRLKRRLWRKYLWRPVLRRILCRVLSEGDILLVGHVHLLPILENLPIVPKVRKLIWVHGLEVWGAQAQRWAPLLQKLDQIVSVSEYTRKELVSTGITTPIVVIPNSVDTTFFTPTSTPERIRRNEILICGRIVDGRPKGHDLLLESLPVAEQLLGFELTLRIIGDGDDKKRLQAKAIKLGLENRVLFMGRVSSEELLEAYRHCGVFCMPSQTIRRDEGYSSGEGFGLVYIEAAACGRPAIAGKGGGASEAVRDGESGFLIDPMSVSDLACAITEILGNRQKADDMGRYGRILVDREFSSRKFQKNIEKLIGPVRHENV